jgi:hypothetical protein
VEIIYISVFGYDLLCDLLEMLNLINIDSAVATLRNLVDPIQRTNMRGLMAERFYFFPFMFYFMYNSFSAYFSILSPFFSSIDFLKIQK